MQFGNLIYKQKDGLPMGGNFSVSFANIAVFLLVETNRELANFQDNLKFYTRYIDDTLGIWKGTVDKLRQFFQQFNSHNKIKWTLDCIGNKIQFLDIQISANKDSGEIETDLYQKAMNKYLYIPFDSNHTIHTKHGWIKGELIRICRNSSKLTSFTINVSRFRDRLQKRGYPTTFIDPILNDFRYSKRNELLGVDCYIETVSPPKNPQSSSPSLDGYSYDFARDYQNDPPPLKNSTSHTTGHFTQHTIEAFLTPDLFINPLPKRFEEWSPDFYYDPRTGKCFNSTLIHIDPTTKAPVHEDGTIIKDNEKRKITQNVNFTTSHNLVIRLLMKSILDSHPDIELSRISNQNQFNRTKVEFITKIKTRISYRIDNTLKKMFTHKQNEQKVKLYLQGQQKAKKPN
jgi:hypothetical protein